MNLDPNVVLLISGAISLVTIVVLLVVVIKLVTLSKSLQRIAEQVPGTGMTAKELAGELGGSIETSFQKYVPQPDSVSKAITGAVESALKTALSGVDGIHKELQKSQDAILEKWTSHEKTSAATLEGVRKALDTATSQFEKGLGGGSQKLQSSIEEASKKLADGLTGIQKKLEESQNHILDKWVSHEKNSSTGLDGVRKALDAAVVQFGTGFTGGSQKLQVSMDDGSKKLTESLNGVVAKLDASLRDHAEKTTKASQHLAEQLEKIVTLEKEIQKILHIQQTTEGAIKLVSTSEEFKLLISSLRTHLGESDKLLREAAKPRVIRLVEHEHDEA